LFGLGLGLSLALHLGFAIWILDRRLEKPGAVSLPSMAISVNLERSDILEAAAQSAAKEAAAARAVQAAVQQDKAESKPLPPAAPPEPETSPPPPAAQPEAAPIPPTKTAEEPPAGAGDAAIERERQAKVEAEKQAQEKARQLAEERERLRREEEAREAEKQRRLEAETAARERKRRAAQSAGVRGSQGAQASKGRVSASQGDIRNYAAAVRAHIARNKPAGHGATGEAIVAFAISPSGGVTSVRIVRTSGNAALDKSALAAVHSASPFPPPPQGVAVGQLRFTIPFDFR
jgi:protein TonB